MESSTESKPRVCFQFEVEKIIGVSSDGNYQVQWAPAWVSKFHLVGCEHLVQEFLQQQTHTEIKLEPEPEIELSDTNPSNYIDFNGEIEGQSFQQQSEEAKAKHELELELTYMANEVYGTTQDVLPEQLKSEPEIQLEMDEVFAEEEHDHSEQLVLHESNDQQSKRDTANEDILMENDAAALKDLAEDVPVSNDISLSEEKNALSTTDPPLNQSHSSQDREPSTSIRVKSKKQMKTKKNLCTVCGKVFPSPSSLTIHMRVHSGERPYSCPQCDKTFSLTATLKLHLRVHTGERPYACEQCGKSFSDKSNFTKHHRTHTGNKPYSCSNCGKTFIRKDKCKRHISRCMCTTQS